MATPVPSERVFLKAGHKFFQIEEFVIAAEAYEYEYAYCFK